MSEAQGEAGAAQAAAVPGPAPAPGRVRARTGAAPSPADPGRRVQPVVRRHPVDHRHAATSAAGEGRATSPTGSAPRSATSSPSTRASLEILRDLLDRQGRRRPALTDDDLAAAVVGGARPAAVRGGTAGAARELGPGRPARPRVALPAEGPARRPAGGPQRPDGLRARARPEPAAGDHPGARGGPAEEGQRARRLHPDRRDGPGQRPAAAGWSR